MAIAVLAGVAIGCGGPARPDTTAPADTDRNSQPHDTRMGHMGEMGHKEGNGEMAEMAAMPPEVAKFHATLAPRWHAEHGPQRMTDTCAALSQLQLDAQAIAAAKPPGGARPEDWSVAGKQLGDAVGALDATCKARDAAAFEQAFAHVHDSFHGVVAAVGDSHEDPGKHAPGEHEHRP